MAASYAKAALIILGRMTEMKIREKRKLFRSLEIQIKIANTFKEILL